MLDTSIAACIIPFTNFQPFQAWVSKKLPIIFVIKKMKNWKGVPVELIAGQAVQKRTSNPELHPYWPLIVLAGTPLRAPLLHCTQPAALRQKPPHLSRREKPLINTIIWNTRRNISLTLLQIKGYTPNLASHKGREKNNKRNVRVGKHTTPSKYRNLSLAISSRAFTPKNKNTHKTFNAHKKNKNKKTREDGVKRKKILRPAI